MRTRWRHQGGKAAGMSMRDCHRAFRYMMEKGREEEVGVGKLIFNTLKRAPMEYTPSTSTLSWYNTILTVY